jgi:hypothetical protein
MLNVFYGNERIYAAPDAAPPCAAPYCTASSIGAGIQFGGTIAFVDTGLCRILPDTRNAHSFDDIRCVKKFGQCYMWAIDR